MARARRSRRRGAGTAARPAARKRARAALRPARRAARRPGKRAPRRASRAGGAPRTGPWELLATWSPARVPVIIWSVEARGAEAFPVARGAWWVGPPPPLALPAPDARGRFAFSWSLQPDGGAARMQLWLRRAGGGRKVAVAASRAVPSGRRWEGKGRSVAAP